MAPWVCRTPSKVDGEAFALPIAIADGFGAVAPTKLIGRIRHICCGSLTGVRLGQRALRRLWQGGTSRHFFRVKRDGVFCIHIR